MWSKTCKTLKNNTVKSVQSEVGIYMTTKEKLEQLGWEIKHIEIGIEFGTEHFYIFYETKTKKLEIDRYKTWKYELDELQLILDYIKENKNE